MAHSLHLPVCCLLIWLEFNHVHGFAGFESCLNARADKPAELIAKYLDSILRRGSKAGAQEASLEDVLDAALALFRYVQVWNSLWAGG